MGEAKDRILARQWHLLRKPHALHGPIWQAQEEGTGAWEGSLRAVLTGFRRGPREVLGVFSALFLSIATQKGCPAAPLALRTAAADAMKGCSGGLQGPPGGKEVPGLLSPGS